MPESTNHGRTLDRALDIIEYVATATTPLRLTDIAKGTGLHLATTQRMINNLAKRGYLTNQNNNYTTGPAALPLARAFTFQDRLSYIAYPILYQLTDQTNITSSLYVRVHDHRILTARAEPPTPLRYQLPIGEKMELTFGAGRIFLASADNTTKNAMIEKYGPVFNYADGRTQNKQEFLNTLDQIAKDGYYISANERVAGTVALNVPIHNHNNTLIAALNLVAHDETHSYDSILKHKPALLTAARTIGQML